MHHIPRTVYDLIDLRSFSNLWYWIALAVMWSTASHWVLGVPYDMVTRARRHGGEAEADLEALTRINVNRLMYIARVSGAWLLGLACCLLTMLAVLGFWYWYEFAQAVLLLAAPMMLVGVLSLYAARQIEAGGHTGEALRRRLLLHRFHIQLIGIVAIFVTAMWGMYQNIALGAFG